MTQRFLVNKHVRERTDSREESSVWKVRRVFHRVYEEGKSERFVEVLADASRTSQWEVRMGFEARSALTLSTFLGLVAHEGNDYRPRLRLNGKDSTMGKDL